MEADTKEPLFITTTLGIIKLQNKKWSTANIETSKQRDKIVVAMEEKYYFIRGILKYKLREMTGGVAWKH